MCKQLARKLASPLFGFSSAVHFLLVVLSCYSIEFRYSLPRFKIWEGGASVSFVVWSCELLLSSVLGVERGRSLMLSAEMVRDPWRDVSCVQLPFD